jgi:hypothetical protein
LSRRVRLPAADELFRATTQGDHEISTGSIERLPSHDGAEQPSRRASGRIRHDEKMTVYVTAEELLEIEQARLQLRGLIGGAVDRGRVVRAAVAMALADLDSHGEDSELVRRLRGT